MSWQTYVDEQLMQPTSPGHCLTSAAIVGLDGNILAKSDRFVEIKPEELEAILKGFDDSASLEEHGFNIDGTKYTLVQGDPGLVIRGRKHSGGICVKKTKTTLVIGIYGAPTAPAECNVVVEKLGDSLIEQGL